MDEKIKFWYLRNHKLFSSLSYTQIKQLNVISGHRKAKKGEIIYDLTTDIPRIYFLKEGIIKIVEIDEEGNESIKDIVKKGDLFGELTLETDASDNSFAKVISDDVSICSFSIVDFEGLLLQNPSLSLSYAKLVGIKMKYIKNNYSNLISKDAKTRLHKFIKNWGEADGKRVGNRVRIENYLTQKDIAQIICTTRQTATELINEMVNKGLIIYDRKLIIIPDILNL